MEAICEPFEKMAKAQKSYQRDQQIHLQHLIETLSSSSDLSQIQVQAKQLAQKVQDCGKDYYSTIQKYSKSVEKKLKFDLDQVWDPKAFQDKQLTLTQIIIQHFVRQGRFDIARTLANEAGVIFEEKLHHEYVGMFHIQEALRNENADLAIIWACQNSQFLLSAGSSLEFKLHQLKFLSFVKNGMVKNALDYAMNNFYRFHDTELPSILILTVIKKLMCSILYIKKLNNCPYSHFFDPQMWQTVQTLFAREFSRTLGQSFESPLYTSVTVGSTALPMIMKISSLMKDKALEWTQTSELPVTIPLLESQRYHSIFICPVTKERGTDLNPPMLIVCGHVISKETLARISKGSLTSRFKCPYCPGESTATQAVRVFF
jgi:hypothetical protein